MGWDPTGLLGSTGGFGGVCAGRTSSLGEDLLQIPKGFFADPASYIQFFSWNFTKMQAFHLSADVSNDLWESWVEMRKQI